jgi:hypothetical protein
VSDQADWSSSQDQCAITSVVEDAFEAVKLQAIVLERALAFLWRCGDNCQVHIDLRGRDLESVTDFIFGHPAPDDPNSNGWYWDVDLTFDPREQVAHLTAIFRNAADLRSRYSPGQLEEGFWYLISDADGGLCDLLWNTAVPWGARAQLIDATVALYRDLFAVDALDTSSHMFWDGIAYDYGLTRDPKTNAEDCRVQDAMYDALVQILLLDSLACQRAALHGLGHLRHRETEKAVESFLARNPKLSEKDRAYARTCASGTME